jgi:hypothetical protein
MEQTVYTVVAKPEDERIWIRVPNVTSWQQINYGFLFDDK